MTYSAGRFMTLEQIRELVTADFEAVDRVVKHRLHSQVTLVDQVATYIIYAGGKRLRPLLVLLAARACGHRGEQHIEAAAIVEFIHTATLLHDDVVDGSSLRRGRDTANEVFGNATSVLVGDFLYSRAFQMMVALDRMPIMQIMADATNAIAEGEVLQLMNAHDPNTSEERYIDVIRRKTARLFQAGAQIGAVLGDAPPAHRGLPRPLRQTYRHRVSAGRRCARLSGRRSQPRQTLGRRSGGGQTHSAADLRNAAR